MPPYAPPARRTKLARETGM